ncbi:GGDEF domain-containing response regulator [Phycisphaera mikurensis]|uniref:diguanylate cyclase n=1 Tax=Phycisphaera mikurensis (strain NBRC 102666 / KCTC 22515 / FYK2301M01) TaxID=1142394 RepID=I0IAU8_PHYMF|nr:diguanylate cyclase [Phycisphaera mikurensis]MBB6442639.1 diguanylate cyclase (GGDEF)-like protein [Phycisphaera mikurensis]BAM02386.1 putative response regulator receiver protein [Phycisphaera mikurensis NBRC 102666]
MESTPPANAVASPSPRLLLIEDDPDTADLILETVQDYFGRGCCDHAPDAAAARAADIDGFDLVLSDMNLPDGTGLEVMDSLLERRPDLPIVFVTGENILGNAVAAVKKGAYDYVVKAGDYLFTIPVVVEKNLELWRIKQDNQRMARELAEMLGAVQQKNRQLEEAVARAETLAATDPLTGLANRRSLNKSLSQRFAETKRSGGDLAVLMMDLDGFKGLNDHAGHPAGDRMLVAAARAIEANCRHSDVAGRFGGDEFVVVLPSTGLDLARGVAERIREDFEASARGACREVGYPDSVSMSAGLATLRGSDSRSVEQLVAHADAALYAAKAAGKRRLEIYTREAA